MLSERFLPFFEWCGKTWLGSTVRDTVWAFPLIETFHLTEYYNFAPTSSLPVTRWYGFPAAFLSGLVCFCCDSIGDDSPGRCSARKATGIFHHRVEQP